MVGCWLARNICPVISPGPEPIGQRGWDSWRAIFRYGVMEPQYAFFWPLAVANCCSGARRLRQTESGWLALALAVALVATIGCLPVFDGEFGCPVADFDGAGSAQRVCAGVTTHRPALAGQFPVCGGANAGVVGLAVVLC